MSMFPTSAPVSSPEFQEFRGANVIDADFAADVFGWDVPPTDAELAEFYEHAGQATMEDAGVSEAADDQVRRRWFTAWWMEDIAEQSEASLLWSLGHPVDASLTNGVDLTPLIVAELMFRSGGAFTLAA